MLKPALGKSFVSLLCVAAAIALGGAAVASDAPPAMVIPGQFVVGATGAATYSIPITTPPGTAGVVPSVSLNYSSQGEDGVVGWQWALGGLSAITRCPLTVAQDSAVGGINYDSNDRFCLDGQRLIAISGTYGANATEYRTETDTFSKIVSYSTAGSGPSYFKVWLRSGRVLEFGNTTDSKILGVGISSARVWAMNKLTDTKGNYYTVSYTNDTTNGQYYPTRIDYTGNAGASLSPYNSVQFTFNTTRADVVPKYEGGSLIQTTALLTHVKTYNSTTMVLDYQLGYTAGTSTTHTRLTSVTVCDGSSNCLAPTTFTWQGTTDTVTLTTTTPGLPAEVDTGDFNGDGIPDIITKPSGTCGSSDGVYYGTGSGTFSSTRNIVACLHPTDKVADIDGDGYSDVFINGVAYTNNHSGSLNSNTTNNSGTAGFGVADYNADHRSDGLKIGSGIHPTWTYPYTSNGNGTFTQGTLVNLSNNHTYNTSVDFNGDGCADIVWDSTTSYGLSGVIYSCGASPGTATLIYGESHYFGDYNGDGKMDVIGTNQLSGGQLSLSTGPGFVTTSFTVPMDWVDLRIGDFNHDGMDDVLVLNTANGQELWISTGSGFVRKNIFAWSGTPGSPIVGDYNGDGSADIWNGNREYTAAFTPEVITGISNGVGATTTIGYGRLNDNGGFYAKGSSATHPVEDLDGAFYVVAQSSTSNGVGGSYVVNYAYSGAITDGLSRTAGWQSTQFGWSRADLEGKHIIAFAQIKITDTQTGVVRTTNYHTDVPYIGLVASQTAESGSVEVASTTNTYADTTSGGVHFVHLTESVSLGRDLNNATLPTRTTDYTYDSYGNQTVVAVTLSGGSSQTVTNTFTNDTTNWILGQVATTSVENIVGSSDITRKTCFNHDSSSGLVTREVIEPTTGSCAYSSTGLQTDYTLDAFGNRTVSAVSGSGITTRSTGATYDSAGEFITASTNALSQSDSGAYSAAFGVPTSHTDANGAVTSWSYDTLGRLTQVTGPVGTKTVLSYAFCSGVNGGSASCPTYGAFLVQAKPTASNGTTQIGSLTTTYYDMLGRPIAFDTQGFDGSNIRVATVYDANGRVYETSRPYFTSGGTAKWTVNTYDVLGRVVLQTYPNSSTLAMTYNALTVSKTNDHSQVTTTVANAQGLPYTVTDAASHTTTYTYDAFGNVKTVTDHLGNVITYTYDTRGNRTAVADPDMGSWSYTYDVLGEMLTQVDAKSQTTTLTYDVMGRPATRSESGYYTAWTYGTSSGSHNIGNTTEAKVCTNSGCSSVISDRTYTYDSLGRSSTGALALGGTTYTTTTTYDTYGRVSTVARPSGFTTQNVYNGYGYLCRVTDNAGSPTCSSAGGANIVWTAGTRNAELQLTQITAGNGIVTTSTFDANTGRMATLRAGPSDSVAALDYTWDTLGNLTYRSDNYQGLFEKFCYDSMNRLTESATGTSGISACSSTGAGITHKTLSYDAVGNITAKSDVGSTYTYPTSGSSSVRPHAISSITGTVNGVTNPSYTYDSNGNMTAGAGRSVSYTSFNMADTVTQGTTTVGFTYDDNHARVTQAATVSGTTTNTTYLNDPVSGTMSEKAVTGGTTVWRDYVQADGGISAMRSCTGSSPCSSGASWIYFVGDDLGSTAALTNGSGTVTERLSYDAWGRRRNSNGTDNSACSITSATTRGFTGHEEMDSVCEVNANARIYDPTVGRFMSPDTIVQDPQDSQALNRYSYVQNNPLSAGDPTGHCMGGGMGATGGGGGGDEGCGNLVPNYTNAQMNLMSAILNIAMFNAYVRSQGGWSGPFWDARYSNGGTANDAGMDLLDWLFAQPRDPITGMSLPFTTIGDIGKIGGTIPTATDPSSPSAAAPTPATPAAIAADIASYKPAGLTETVIVTGYRVAANYSGPSCTSLVVTSTGICLTGAAAAALCPETAPAIGGTCWAVPPLIGACVGSAGIAMGVCLTPKKPTYSRSEPTDTSREDRCEANLTRDLATCKALGNRSPSRGGGKKAYKVCEAQAMLRYGNCLAGRDGDDGINAPLPQW